GCSSKRRRSPMDLYEGGQERPGQLLDLVDPRHLDRLEDLLPAVLRVVVELVEFLHPLEQVGETHGQRVNVGILLRERDGDFEGVGPFHGHLYLISFTMLMVYFGISMVRSLSLTIAWHDSLD